MKDNYYDYFQEQPHEPDNVTMDEFIAEAMRTDLNFQTIADEMNFLKHSKVTLKTELLTCYEYLESKGLLELYQAYRNGEELPFD